MTDHTPSGQQEIITMKTFPDPRLTAADFAAGMRAHAEADDLVRGTYGDTDSGRFRGCAVGCNIEVVKTRLGIEIDRGDHEALGAAIGVPSELLHLQDALFEGLQGDASSQFAVAFAAALRDGQDLSRVSDLFLADTLRDDVLPLVTDDHPNVRVVVVRVADGCADGWQNDDRDAAGAAGAAGAAARAAAWAAGAAAGDAARAARAAEAAAWAAEAAGAAWAAVEAAEAAAGTRAAEAAAEARAAEAAARAAEAAARARVARAAEAAAWAAGDAGDAAWDAAHQRMADRLVRLIGEAE
ncbi:hypothetical protein RADP37_05403 (plasmid) [Roseomonas mucosa]|uniref:Uncharacterized protein n=1 Tax=Roseomonas mucosa TaxID=207340 RepID=A0A4Y1MQS7_9PROT|nr:hypothetical protein [Roseomonas mucosa]AWV20326.1 hypothetical protein RADP37_05403 [Roseomonas mucosa]